MIEKLTKKEKNANKRKILKELKKVQRDGIEDLVSFLSDESDFFEAPASTMFHGNHDGGLAQHSYQVYKAFERKNSEYELNLDQETLILVGICHDFDKINKYEANILASGNISSSKPYKVKQDFPYGHGDNSVRVLENFIKLTDKEALLIRWHMCTFDREYENYERKLKKVCPELIALHCADQEVSAYIA